MQVTLRVVSGTHQGKDILVKDEKFFIGRCETCQLRPKSESISRKHCAIVQKDGRVLLADLKSRNGTFINDVKVEPEKAKVLKSGDMIRVGQLEFQIFIEVSLGGAKKPEVNSVKEAVARVAENGGASASDPRTDVVEISSWLSEPDTFDRAKFNAEPETQMVVTGEDTTRIDMSSEDSKIEEPGAASETPLSKRPEKKGPMKLPKHHMGPVTKNSKDAATDALKKYFGGR